MKARTVPISGLLAFIFFALTGHALATNYYVNANTGSDANNGLSDATAKATIQAAVNTAASNDVIFVRAGTYTEQVHIVNKTLTLRGSGADSTIVRMPSSGQVSYSETTLLSWNGAGKLASSTFYPVIYADAASNANDIFMYDMKVTGDYQAPGGTNLFIGIAVKNAGGEIGDVLDDVKVDSMRASTITADNTGFGVMVFGRSAVTLSHVTARDYQTAGIAVIGRSLSSTLISQMPNPVIVDCELYGRSGNNNAGIHAGILSAFGARATIQRTVSANHSNAGAGSGAGLYAVDVRTHLVGSTTVKADGNSMADNKTGMTVIVQTSGASPTNLTIKNNNIAFNTAFAVVYDNSLGSTVLTLNSNAWGKYAGAVAGDFGGTDAANVTYTLPQATDTARVDDDYHLDRLPTYGYSTFARIGNAYGAMLTSGEINVNEGTYNEGDIAVNRTMSFFGAKAGQDARTRDLDSGESVIDASGSSGSTFVVTADSVEIDGFTIKNSSIAVEASTAEIAHLDLLNNYVLTSGIDAYQMYMTTICTIEQNLIIDVSGGFGITGGSDNGTPETTDDVVLDATIRNNRLVNVYNAIDGYMENSTIDSNEIYIDSLETGWMDHLGNGVAICGSLTSTSIQHNIIDGYNGDVQASSGGAGILLCADGFRPVPSDIDMDSNHITNGFYGITLLAGTDITITNSVFETDSVYISNEVDSLSIDARTNLFDGKNPTLLSGLELVILNSKIHDDHDDSLYGEVILKEDFVFVTPWGLLQPAVDTAGAGDTIFMATGIYNEPTVVIDDKVQMTLFGDTLVGPKGMLDNGLKIGSDSLVLTNVGVRGQADGSTGVVSIIGTITGLSWTNVMVDGENAPGRFGVINGQIGGNIFIGQSQFENIDGWAAFDTRSGASSNDGSNITGVLFANNRIHKSKGHINFRHDAAIFPYPDINISFNTADSTGSATNSFGGLFKTFRADTVTFIINTIRNVGTSGFNPVGEAAYGAAFLPRQVNHVFIEANTFEKNNQAVAIEPGRPVPTGVIRKNNFDSNTYGVYIPANASAYGDLVIDSNRFNDNSAQAVHNGGDTVISALANWWGAMTGPAHPSNSVVTTGDSVSDNVAFHPWWGTISGTVGNYTGTLFSPITSSDPVAGFASFQEAIDAANPGAIIEAGPFQFEENFTIKKAVTVKGMGVGSTRLRNHTAGGATIIIDSVMATVGDPVTVSDIRLVKKPGVNTNGIWVANSDHVLLHNLQVDSFAYNNTEGHGIYLRDGNLSNVTIRGCEVWDNNSGITTGNALTLDGLTVDSTLIKHNSMMGLNVGAGAGAQGQTNITVTNSTIDNNGWSSFCCALGRGWANASFFDYNGNLTMTNVDVIGPDGTPGNEGPHHGIHLRGATPLAPMGTVVFTDVTISGNYRSTNNPANGGNLLRVWDTDRVGFGLNINRYTTAPITMSGMVFNLTGPNSMGFQAEDMNNRIISVGDAEFNSTTTGINPHIFANASSFVSAVDASFGGTPASSMTREQLLDLEDRIYHGVDDTTKGFVDIRYDVVFVTTNANVYQGPMGPGRIRNGVVAAAAWDTVEVSSGTFNETVLVDSVMTLRGNKFGQVAHTRDTTVDETIVNGSGGAFNLAANGVKIDGFKVQGVSDAPLGAGIYTNPNFSEYYILNNVISDNIMGLYLNSDGTWESLVEGNFFVRNNETGASSGNGIYSDQGLTDAVISNNRFVGHTTAGINMADNAYDITVTGNSLSNDNSIAFFGTTKALVTGNTNANANGSAVYIGGGNDSITIEYNNLWDGTATGVRIADDFAYGINSNIRVTNNNITSNDYGVRVGAGAATQSVRIFNNNIAGNLTKNIDNDDADTIVMASGNWFGFNDPGTVSGGIEGSVEYSPWLDNGNNGAPNGFDGDFSAVVVWTGGSHIGPQGRIDDGVDMVDDEGTVRVKAGTYTETVNLEDSVVVIGDPLDGNGKPVVFVDAGTGAAITSTGAENKSVERIELQITDNTGRFGLVPDDAGNSGNVTFTDMRFNLGGNIVTGTAVPGVVGTDVPASIDDGNDAGFGPGVFILGNAPITKPARYIVTGDPVLADLTMTPTVARDVATATLTLRAESTVNLGVYDINGILVRNLAEGETFSGERSFTIDVTDLGSGAYFLRLETGGQTRTVPIRVVK